LVIPSVPIVRLSTLTGEALLDPVYRDVPVMYRKSVTMSSQNNRIGSPMMLALRESLA
jgi:hypothetical protein